MSSEQSPILKSFKLLFMKYIRKNLKNEPEQLRVYRMTTPNATYKGYGDTDSKLKTALLGEQGYLCAYCMKSIAEFNTTVEHFESQELNPKLQLKFSNMLAVCDGSTISYPEKEALHHCDKTKPPLGKMNGQVKLNKLDPRSVASQHLVTYTFGGEILSVNSDTEVEHDLNRVLNLNNKALITSRRIALDLALDKMKKEKPVQEWNRTFFQKHLDEWQTPTDLKYCRFCMIAVWFLTRQINKI